MPAVDDLAAHVAVEQRDDHVGDGAQEHAVELVAALERRRDAPVLAGRGQAESVASVA